jgi:hypothetical protein
LETASDIPPYDARFIFGVTNETRRTILIPSNGNEPAISVLGIRSRSKLTASSDLKGGNYLITTEGYGGASLSTVIEPTVRDLYLFGNQGVANSPYTNEGELALGNNAVCHAIALDADAPTVTNNKIYDFRGDAISVSNSTDEISRMVRMPRITNNKISHCWNGIVAAAPDTQIDGNRVASVRDIGIHAIGGSIQCSNNHVFGAKTAIQFEGGPSRSIGDRFSDAGYGFRIESGASGSHIADGTTEHCYFKNILADAQRIRIHNTRILVANTSDQHEGEMNSGIESIVGLHITGNAFLSLISDCDIEVGAFTFKQADGSDDTGLEGSTGILLDANNVTIDNLKIIGNIDISGEIGIRVLPHRTGGEFFIDARGGGFRTATGDRVVKFDAPGMGQNHCTGQVWYILHDGLDTPVEISANWGSNLQIFTRSSTAGEWIRLTTGVAYPP